MSRERTTDELSHKPTRSPMRRSKKRPSVAPINTPESTPENTVYWLHELLNFEQHRKCHPNYFGEYLGEFLTPLYAKRWLKDHGRYGAFAIVERTNGKIGKSWPYEIDAPDDDAGIDYNSNGDPRIENAALKARIEVMRNGAHNGYDPVTKAVMERVVPEMLKPKSLAEQLREVKEVNELMNHRREVNPAPQQTGDPDLEIIKTVLPLLPRDDASTKETISELLGRYINKADPWLEFAEKTVTSGQGANIIQAFWAGASNFVSMFKQPQQAPVPQAPQPPQAHAQQYQPAPQMPPIQPPQPAPQSAPAQQTQAAQTAPSQPAQTAPEIAADPYTAMITNVITQLANNAPVDDAIKTVNGFLLLNPQYAEVIDQQFGQPSELLLSAISSLPGCEAIPKLAHSKQWVEDFQAKFFDEGEFDQLTELNQPATAP